VSSRVTNPLSSYDLVAKSLPGVVLLFLVVSFLPPGSFTPVPVASSLAEYALTVITALLVGLFVGESVHTFAELIERGVRFGARVVDRISSRLSVLVGGKLKAALAAVLNHNSIVRTRRTVGGQLEPVVVWIPSWLGRPVGGATVWLQTKYWGLHDILKDHRLLFAHSLIWNFAQQPDEVGDRWENRQKGHPYECFRECLLEEYGEDLLKNESGVAELENLEPVAQYRSLYTLVSSEVSSSGIGLSSRFQAIYSFCRSMYVVFGLTTVAYLLILSPTTQSGAKPVYSPMVVSALPREWYAALVIVPFVLSLIFFVATGKYKRAYVDYLISDFCALKRSDLDASRQYSPHRADE
jgi:hypothetical protein